MKPNTQCNNEKCKKPIYVNVTNMNRYDSHYCSNACKNHNNMAWSDDKLQYVLLNYATRTAADMAAHFGCKVTALYKQIYKWRKAGVAIPQLLHKTPEMPIRQKAEKKSYTKPKAVRGNGYDNFFTHHPINLNKGIYIRENEKQGHIHVTRRDARTMVISRF